MTPALHVVGAGPFTTLQDLGRIGYQRFGVSVAGAMDPVALRVANLLVGNPAGLAVLEMTLGGGTFEVDAATARVAVAGDVEVRVDGQRAGAWRSFTLGRGQEVAVGPVIGTARAYLAAAGGFAVAPTLGSVSTHVRSAMGGLDGGPLRDGDRLPLVGDAAPAGPDLAFESAARTPPDAEGPVRVVLGPQDDAFTAEGIATFLSTLWTVSALSDRMGCRLEGPVLAHAGGFNIVSDGIAPGSVQVPGAGLPIVLLADRQTTGGYPKIATVISADLPRFGQLRPGASIRFRPVSVDEGQAAYRARAAWLAGLPGRLVEATGGSPADLGALWRGSLVSGVVDACVRGSSVEP